MVGVAGLGAMGGMIVLVISTGTEAASSAGVAVTCAPSSTRGAAFAVVRFQTITGWPASRSRRGSRRTRRWWWPGRPSTSPAAITAGPCSPIRPRCARPSQDPRPRPARDGRPRRRVGKWGRGQAPRQRSALHGRRRGRRSARVGAPDGTRRRDPLPRAGDDSPASETARRRPLLEAGDYPARFSLTLAAKDAGLIVDAAAGERLRLLEGVREWLVEAGAQGRGEQDCTAVLAAITGR